MSIISVDRLLKLLDGSQLNPGTAGAWLRRAERSGSSRVPLTDAQKVFLRDVAASEREVVVPTHPEDEASQERWRRPAGEDLTDVELVWLQRLPVEADRVTFDDAVQLAALEASIDRMKTPSSARLVASIWDPVKDRFDESVARARVKRIEQLTKVPASTRAAIRDAMMDEYPGASEEMVDLKARDLLETFTARRQERKERDLARAKAQLAEVLERVARRSDMSRETTQKVRA